MTVLGYDAIHANVSAIPSNAKVVMGYDTGTADIKWTPQDWARFPHARHVHIDQGFGAAFLPRANIIDVERGAYSPAQIEQWMDVNQTPDPGVYCNQSTLPDVLATGYQGILWLAKLTTVEPVIPVIVPGCTVVAQQFEFRTAFDVNAVFKDLWPIPGGPMGSIQYDAPGFLTETATVNLQWLPSPAVDGKSPESYTVAVWNPDGVKVVELVTSLTYIEIPRLPHGTALKVQVWANGGDIAPPGAEILIHT